MYSFVNDYRDEGVQGPIYVGGANKYLWLHVQSQWETRISAVVQTGPGVHPAFCTLGAGSVSWL